MSREEVYSHRNFELLIFWYRGAEIVTDFLELFPTGRSIYLHKFDHPCAHHDGKIISHARATKEGCI